MKTKLRMFKKAFDFFSKNFINNENFNCIVCKKTQKIKIQKFLKRKMKDLY